MALKTVHGATTVHSLETPHKNLEFLQETNNVLNSLTAQLYPTGRAFSYNEDSFFFKFHNSINTQFATLINDAKLLLDGLFPDNDNFSLEDAEIWENRFGLSISENLSLEDRKLIIRRKMAFPNGIICRQNENFIQSQLRDAGFDVYIHPNQPPYQSPSDILDVSLTTVQHGDIQHGNNSQHGGGNFSVIANTTEEVENYAIGTGNLWSTFFIGGENLGDFAEIPSSRLREFKEMVLKLKPCHLTAFTFINFI